MSTVKSMKKASTKNIVYIYGIVRLIEIKSYTWCHPMVSIMSVARFGIIRQV